MIKGKKAVFLLIVLAAVNFICSASFAEQEPKTTVTGDEMQIISGGKKVVYSGNSRVVRGESVLKADRIVQDKNTNSFEASGNIDFLAYSEQKEKITGKSDKAYYSAKDGKGLFSNGRPKLTYHVKTSTGPVELQADSIEFDQKKEEIFAKGNVEVVTSSATAYAPQALFLQKDRTMFMTSDKTQPKVIFHEDEKTGDFNADKITVYIDKKKMKFDKNVNGKVILPD